MFCILWSSCPWTVSFLHGVYCLHLFPPGLVQVWSVLLLIYGRFAAPCMQAVVVSIDPKRVYVHSPEDAPCKTVLASFPGPNGEKYVWYQCTVSGGREARPIGAYEVAQAVEALGAGEILLNCIDKDGQGDGFELDLVRMVSDAVSIPVIASSGAGSPQHFLDVLRGTNASAALAAGIFHRQEVGNSRGAMLPTRHMGSLHSGAVRPCLCPICGHLIHTFIRR